MKNDPHCYWCRKDLIYFLMESGQTLPDNFATLDHINSRLMHPEGRPPCGKIVLACPGCNQGRNIEEQISLPREKLWEASGRYPQVLEFSTTFNQHVRELREGVNQWVLNS
jgi:hypothetical protein